MSDKTLMELLLTPGTPEPTVDTVLYGVEASQDSAFTVAALLAAVGVTQRLEELEGMKEVELQATATHIQWRREGEAWQDLIALSELQGPQGLAGADGQDGVNVTITATTDQSVYDAATPTATELVVLYDA